MTLLIIFHAQYIISLLKVLTDVRKYSRTINYSNIKYYVHIYIIFILEYYIHTFYKL